MKSAATRQPVDSADEIPALIATLLATERRLVALTAGEVDAVSDGEGRTFLLQRAQEQLRRREAEKQATILDALPARIALLDVHGVITSVNEPWRRFGGDATRRAPEPGIGLNYPEVCDALSGEQSGDARRVAAGIRAVLARDAASFSWEYSRGTPAEERWYRTVVTPLPGGRPNGAVVMHLDVTERRRVERELEEAKVAGAVREGENRLGFLADAIPMIVWTASPDGRVDYFNQAWFDYTGFTAAQSQDGGWNAALHPADQARCLECWAHACETGENYEIEYRFQNGSYGSYRWFLGRASARRNARGEIVQWVGTCTDIEDQKRAVAELQSARADLEERVAVRTAELSVMNKILQAENIERGRTELALRESNEKFQQLAANISDAFWIRSADMREVHYVSPAFEQIWGRPVQTLYDHPNLWTEFIFSEDRARVAEAFDGLSTEAPTVDIEYRIVRPSGEIRWVHVRGTKIRNASAEAVRHVGVVTDITERRASATALRTSLAEFRMLAEAMPQIVWIALPDGGATYLSQQWTDYTGRSVAEGLGQGWIEPFHPDDRPRALVAWQRATETGEVYATECRLRRADGAYRWWLMRGVPIRDADGPIAKWFGTCTDVHDLKLAELAVSRTNLTLQDQQTELRALIDMVPAMIAFKDADNILRRVNHQLADSLGKSVAEIEGKTSAEVFRENAAQYDADDRQVIESGEPIKGLVKSSHDREGREVWHQVDKVPVRDIAGNVMGLVVMAQDITERKRAEVALQTSEKRFKALFDHAGVGVALVDAVTGRFAQVNQRLCVFMDRSREALEAITIYDVTHPLDLARSAALVQQLKSGAIREFTQEKRFVRPDGSAAWGTVSVAALWAPGDAPDYCIAVTQDDTERKRLEDQFRQAQKMEAVGTLAGGIAHDFNNILAAINGYAELSQIILSDNPEVRSNLGAILQAAHRAAHLVKQILTFSRQQPLERRPMQLLPVVSEALALLRATIPSTIEFETLLPTNAPTVLADATQVHQIMMNLGTNAWHAMKDRPGRLKVTLESCVVDATHAATQSRLLPGNYARVSVSDTGAGMSPATQRRIFEPFFTTKPLGEGTGLGLAVVHGIMETHEGAITVYSEPGEGTVFHLYFPAHAGESALAPSDTNEVPRGNGQRVLFVDDEELLVQLGRKALGALGYEVETVQDPLAALALVRANPSRFDLVITDQTMPRMTGLVLAGELHQIRPGLPIILTSGYSQALTANSAEAAGIRELLLKPFTIRSLGYAVQAALTPAPITRYSHGSNSPY